MQIVLSPAGASQDRSDCLGTKGLTEVMVHQKHPTSVRVLIEMVGTSAFSLAKPVGLDGPLPVLCAELSERREARIKRQGQA
jgi:hypothetical protein